MPTSSQAMIQLTDQGEDPRIPRRHFPSSVSTLPPVVREYRKKAAGTPLLRCFVTNRSNYPVIYNTKLNILRYNEMKPKLVQSEEKGLRKDSSKAAVELPKSSSTTSGYMNHEDHLIILGNLGFKRRNACPVRNRRIIGSTTSLPKDALYKPGRMSEYVSQAMFTTNGDNHGDKVCTIDNQTNSVKEKPKSLLDELKESVSYDTRLLPSMEMRKELPPSRPDCVVFSLRNNDVYSHDVIKGWIESKTGLKTTSVLYDPVNVRTGNSEIPSRWIIQFGSPNEARSFLHHRLEMDGEKIVVQLLDDIHKMEVAAYKIKMEEDMIKAQRKTASKKTRRQRTTKKR